MASSGAVTPASPKVIKIKAAKPGLAQFGCGEHFQISLEFKPQPCRYAHILWQNTSKVSCPALPNVSRKL
jgi:ubiquitin carboxyl-terminal hydrolase 22/27/51